MDSYDNFSFDSSNQYFMDAHKTVEVINDEIENLKNDLSIEKNNIYELTNSSPVGFEATSCLNNTAGLDSLVDSWNEIMENANHLREVGDLINKGFTDFFEELFDSQEQFLNFLYGVAAGRESLASLFGDSLSSSIDYYQIFDDGWVVQGYTRVEDESGSRIIISAHPKKEGNARLYIYDAKTGQLETFITLDHNDHVGGISYDSDHQILWVAGDGGTVHSYDYQNIIEIIAERKKGDLSPGETIFDIDVQDYEGVEIPNNIQIKNLISTDEHPQDGMDSIYYYDGKLYSCTYSATGELLVTDLTITRNNAGVEIQDNTAVVAELNGATQGLAVYEEDGKKYLITASSASYATSQSRLTKWEMNDGEIKPVGYRYIDHTGLEGIEIEDGYVRGVFEQGFSFWNQNQSTEILANVNDISEPANSSIDSSLTFGGNIWDSTIEMKEAILGGGSAQK